MASARILVCLVGLTACDEKIFETGFSWVQSPSHGRSLRSSLTLRLNQDVTETSKSALSASTRLLPACFALAVCVLGRRRWYNVKSPLQCSVRPANGVVRKGLHSQLTLFAPAKVNLFLRVTGKQTEGYHDLMSLFHTVDLCDKLKLKLLPSDSKVDELYCDTPGVPLDHSNLIIRALELFRNRSGLRCFFRVELDKTIPAQAGMGGGSSDAAAALFGANLLCGKPASAEELCLWARDPVIGSDAAFFLASKGVALCSGRGEIVEPQAPLPRWAGEQIYLVKPRFGLSTPKVFRALQLPTDSMSQASISAQEMLRTFTQKGLRHSLWVNDLEVPALQVRPELGKLHRFLAEAWGFRGVMMSGSGTTMICIGEPKGGPVAFEEALHSEFDCDGVWRTRLTLRSSLDVWYS